MDVAVRRSDKGREQERKLEGRIKTGCLPRFRKYAHTGKLEHPEQ